MVSKSTKTVIEAQALALSFVRAVVANDDLNVRTIKNTVKLRNKGFASVFEKEVIAYASMRKYEKYADLLVGAA